MTSSPLIQADALQTLLANPAQAVLLLDCSHDLFDAHLGQREFEKAHLPGARFVSMDEVMSGQKTGLNGRHPLPDRASVVRFLQAQGANDDTLIVLYDRSQATYASRVWWTLRWLGHSQVRVLDGGLQAWLAAGGAVESGAVASASTLGTFSDRTPLVHPLSYEEVLDNVKTQQRLVVDARAADRFRGENETLDPVGGHIPGAINRSHRLNLQPDGTFKDAATLAAEFAEQIGARRGSDLIMQCGSGVSACHNLLALEVAGLGDAQLYVGSWSEWCAQPHAPIATGA